MANPINLTKNRPSVTLHKDDIRSGEIRVHQTWRRVPATFDLDLGLMWKAKNGQKSTIQALGRNFGSRRQLPFFELSGDDRRGGTGETITGTYSEVLKHLDWFGVYLYNYAATGDAETLDKIEGAVTTIQFPGQRDIVIEHSSQNGTGSAILQVFNEADGFRIHRDLKPVTQTRGISNQELVDAVWGVGLNWVPARK